MGQGWRTDGTVLRLAFVLSGGTISLPTFSVALPVLLISLN
jgi:hypothetical protein